MRSPSYFPGGLTTRTFSIAALAMSQIVIDATPPVCATSSSEQEMTEMSFPLQSLAAEAGRLGSSHADIPQRSIRIEKTL